MTAKASPERGPKPRLTVIGVGGAGSNAVDNMIRSNLEGVEFIECNTDAQALAQGLAPTRLQLGLKLTQGLGAGSKPEVGRAAAQESMEEILSYLRGTHMLFITAGMGGGTGTGGAPAIAKAAKELGILTVGVITKPFLFEGTKRMETAEQGIEEMYQCVDTLLVIPNQNLFRVANERTTFGDAFAMADNVLLSGVRTFTDLMVQHGLINLDFADICVVMREMMGKAMMGTGQAVGERRAVEAAEMAISCPLLDDVEMQGAKSVLINVTGGLDMTLFEVDEAANRIREEVAPDANIIFGATFDESVSGQIRVSVVATGIDSREREGLRTESESASEDLVTENPFSPSAHERLDSPVSAEHRFSSLEEEKKLIINEKLGHRHDFFSPQQDYPQGNTTAQVLGEPSSHFQTRSQTLEDLYTSTPSEEDNDTTPPTPDKPRGFFGRLAAGVQKRSFVSGSETEQKKNIAPVSRSERKEPSVLHDFLSPKLSREDQEFIKRGEDGFPDWGLETNDSLDIPTFLRNRNKKKKP